MGINVTRENWQRTLWHGSPRRVRAAWEEGLKQQYEQITGQRVEGTGNELKTEAARGMMRFLIKRHAADAKPPSKERLMRETTRLLGLSYDRVRTNARDIRPPRQQYSSDWRANARRIPKEYLRITGQPLEAPDKNITKAAVIGVAKWLAEQHKNDAVQPTRTELSTQAANLLGTSPTVAKKTIRYIPLPLPSMQEQERPWYRSRRDTRAAWEEGLRQRYEQVTGQHLEWTGLELQVKVARGLMKHFAETHKTDAKPPSKQQLILRIAHDFGLSKHIVRRANLPVRRL